MQQTSFWCKAAASVCTAACVSLAWGQCIKEHQGGPMIMCTGAHDFSIYNTGKALFYEGLAVWFWEESRFSRFICAVIHLSIQLHGMWSWRVHLLSSACVYIRFYTSQSYWQLARILTEFCGPQISSLMQQAIIFGVCVCCYACVSWQLHTSFTRYLADHP
jgi:hypothetical protein